MNSVDPHFPPSNLTPINLDSESGPWTGFYLEKHHPQRGWMHLYLEFENGKIRGEGTDYVGPWTLRGDYQLTPATCQWVKSYEGKHQVHYQGTPGPTGILGTWRIGGFLSGTFHIWPASYGDIQQGYLEQDAPLRPPGRA